MSERSVVSGGYEDLVVDLDHVREGQIRTVKGRMRIISEKKFWTFRGWNPNQTKRWT